MNKPKSFSIRIDDKLLHQVRYMAKFEVRSINSEILILLRRAVLAFEKKYGNIPPDSKT